MNRFVLKAVSEEQNNVLAKRQVSLKTFTEYWYSKSIGEEYRLQRDLKKLRRLNKSETGAKL